ncbi:unnamed protein product [Bathycoccus prasinos]
MFYVCLPADGIAYAVGATDSMQGTGVWSGIKMSRDVNGNVPKSQAQMKQAGKSARFPNTNKGGGQQAPKKK